MNVNNASITISAVSPKQYPADGLPEIVFAGRSNVGKSSLINKLTNRKQLARISGTPGKTATINFYNIEDKLYFVDLPGYGYAKVSWSERERWAQMINGYLEGRKPLRAMLLLVDIRHSPSRDDISMFAWLQSSGYDYRVVATKADKLSKTASEAARTLICQTLGLEEERLISFSSKTGEGRDALWAYLEQKIS